MCMSYCTLYTGSQGMKARSTVRALAWTALSAQVAFLLVWVIAGALEPGYSAFHRGFSELAARGAAHPSIAIAGTVALALAIAVLGPALRGVLPSGRSAAVAGLLFVAAGAAIALTAGFRLDCGLSDPHCRHLWHTGQLSWHEDAHVWAGVAAEVLILAAPFAIARALWPAPVAAAALNA